MFVELVSATENPVLVAYTAARRCYSSYVSIADLKDTDRTEMGRLVKNVVAMGHTGIIEPIVYTFHAHGISRVTTHQLVRHRVASFCQQSQRYTKPEVGKTVIPPSVAKNGMYDVYLEACEHAYKAYDALLDAGIPYEDARYVLPNATESSITITMNARELYDVFFPKRLCKRAQWEIRDLAEAMFGICAGHFPAVFFENAGAACERYKYCPEGAYSCGIAPTMDKLLENKRSNKECGTQIQEHD